MLRKMPYDIIRNFERRAAEMNRGENALHIDAAIGLLAAWFDSSRDRLDKEDAKVLEDVGAVLYREATLRRLS